MSGLNSPFLRLYINLLQPCALLWFSDKISIKWLVLLLWTIFFQLGCQNRSIYRLGGVLSVLIGMVFVSACYYEYPSPGSWMPFSYDDSIFIAYQLHIYNILTRKAIGVLVHVSRLIYSRLKQFVKFFCCCVICGLLFCYGMDFVMNRSLTLCDYFLSNRDRYSQTPHRLVKLKIPETYCNVESNIYVNSNSYKIQINREIYVPPNTHSSQYFTRYNGEDVKLECTFLVGGHYGHRTYHWEHHGHEVNASERHSFSMKVLATDSQTRKISMYLMIEVIGDSDFGHYDCVEKHVIRLVFKRPMYISETKKWEKYGEKVIKTIRGENEIRRFQNSVLVVHLHSHSVARFIGHEILTNDEAPISYDYSINNVVFEPSIRNLAVCSFREMFLTFIHEILVEPTNTRVFTEFRNHIERDYDFQDANRYVTTVTFCAQPRVYGWHRLSYFREFYNATINKTEVYEIPYPVTRLVLPEPVDSYLPFINDTELYAEIEAEILGKGSTEDIDQRTLDFLYCNEQKVLMLDNVMTFVLLLLFCYVLKLVCFKVPVYYHRYVVLPVVNWAVPNIDTDEEEQLEDRRKYDIFIGHADEDYPLVSQHLVPHLENDLGLTVCLPDRDCHQGQNIFSLTAQAIEDSRKIIVVLTDSYMADPGCYDMQVTHTLLPIVYCRTRRRKKKNTIMILNLRQCELPTPLIGNADIDRINFIACPENESWRKLDVWIKRCSLR